MKNDAVAEPHDGNEQDKQADGPGQFWKRGRQETGHSQYDKHADQDTKAAPPIRHMPADRPNQTSRQAAERGKGTPDNGVPPVVIVQQEGKGAILYMNQEGRGIGLVNKLKAYKLQENGMDTVEANLHLGFPMDKRDYGIGAQILRYLDITKLRLMSNNPKKRAGLLGYGLEIVETVPIEVTPNPHNEKIPVYEA